MFPGFCLSKNRSVLPNVSVVLPEGKMIGIHRPPGCGKSTILKPLIWYYDVQKDKVRISRENIKIINTGFHAGDRGRDSGNTGGVWQAGRRKRGDGMTAEELSIDLSKHVMYSKTAERVVKDYLMKKVGEKEAFPAFSRIERQYAEFLRDLPYLGGKKSVHNGTGGTYDCIFLFAVYEALNGEPTIQELYDMNCAIFLPGFDRLKKWKLVNANHSFALRLIHLAFRLAAKEKKAEKGPYAYAGFIMKVEPFSKTEGIRYRFDRCPIVEFAKAHGYLDLMPAMCNGDYPAMEDLHAALIRSTTCADGDYCDYWIVGDKSEIAKAHPRWTDECGFWRNTL